MSHGLFQFHLEQSHSTRSVYPQCRKQLRASFAVILSSTDCIVFQSASRVR